jgi:malonyl CoA-acyl carrier protein transacylase
MPLGTGIPFHSRYMTQIEREFERFLEPFVFRAPRARVVANVTGEPYPAGDATEGVRAILVQQITRPVQWTKSIRYLLQQRVTEFHECGVGTTLTRLVQQIRLFPWDPA